MEKYIIFFKAGVTLPCCPLLWANCHWCVSDSASIPYVVTLPEGALAGLKGQSCSAEMDCFLKREMDVYIFRTLVQQLSFPLSNKFPKEKFELGGDGGLISPSHFWASNALICKMSRVTKILSGSKILWFTVILIPTRLTWSHPSTHPVPSSLPFLGLVKPCSTAFPPTDNSALSQLGALAVCWGSKP